MTHPFNSPETTITADAVAAEAALLDEAERSATQLRQTTEVYPDLTIDDAYAIQAAWRNLKLARGERIVGHKIGLTSRAMQAAMAISTPDSGFLTNDMVFEPNSTLDASTFCDPKVEVELAFTLATDLSGSNLTIDDVLAATEFVQPAVELIAARTFRADPTTGRRRTVIDTIADNAANGGIISGGTKVAPNDIDLAWVSAVARRNGTVEETGVAAGVLGHPARGIAWLAKRYGETGQRLEAGQVVLAGSFTRPIDVRPGDDFTFDYGPLGTITMAFS